MKKSQLWKKYVDKNPSFDGNGNITMSAAGLRKLFNQTWDIAFNDGEAEDIEEDYTNCSSNLNSSNTLNDLLNIFGMK
jgi:hypothetical protein